MCTAIRNQHFFGRNLDLEYGYGEQVVITPRQYPLHFRKAGSIAAHHAYMGMAVAVNEFPLYFDAFNEHGLSIAALDFPENAYYPPVKEGCCNIAPFELPHWLLSQCDTVAQARTLLNNSQIADISYDATYVQAPLHWMLSDQSESIVLESTKQGLQIYQNPIDVLTNNPPFPYHLYHLASYQHLSPGPQDTHFDHLKFSSYSGGMDAIGLPGDFSSSSRFIKAAFVNMHAHFHPEETSAVTQFFHILDSVAMPRGAIRTADGKDVITRYSCCCSMDSGVYYYTTYENRRIQAVKLHQGNLDGKSIQVFSLDDQQDICCKNK